MQTSVSTSRRALRGFLGASMTVVGLAAITGLVVIGNCGSDLCERASAALGLALIGLVAAVALVLVVAGAGILWTAIRPSRAP